MLTEFRRAALVGLALMLGACGNSAEVRYKVTVEVDDNGTRRSGSSVWSFKLSKPAIALVAPYQAQFKGEAIALTLPGRGTLYALLAGRGPGGIPGSSSDMAMLPERLFGDPARGMEGLLPLHRDRLDDIRAIARRTGETAVLESGETREPWNNFPFLVRFTDPDDPKSVVAVHPADLAAHFGEGVILRKVSVAVTDDNVTRGNLGDLPYGRGTGFAKWYAGLSLQDPRRIGPEHFRLEQTDQR
ncbi:MAG TPA: hypothetical protein VEZ70_12100 [Allosphingosinicella sp.]|nr:hypothetical protein [Allosphingosinicella sp.]